jgi:hypothetical protein
VIISTVIIVIVVIILIITINIIFVIAITIIVVTVNLASSNVSFSFAHNKRALLARAVAAMLQAKRRRCVMHLRASVTQQLNAIRSGLTIMRSYDDNDGGNLSSVASLAIKAFNRSVATVVRRHVHTITTLAHLPT